MDGPRQRLNRARTHNDDLERQVFTYFQERFGDAYDIIRERDPMLGDYILRLNVRESPPLEDWALIVSDSIHELRSSLDNLMWAVGRRFSSATKLGGMFAFPICPTQRDWLVALPPHSESLRRRIEKVTSAEVVGVLDHLQPYRGRDGPEWHGLSVISQLSNADKHRSPALTIVMLAYAQVSWQGTANVDFAPTNEPFKNNAAVGRLTIVPDDPDVNFDPRLAFDVRLDKKGPAGQPPVRHMLTNLEHQIREVVFPRFEQFF